MPRVPDNYLFNYEFKSDDISTRPETYEISKKEKHRDKSSRAEPENELFELTTYLLPYPES